MAIVIGVRFKRTGKTYYFDPLDFQVREGDCVIVETSRGIEFGEVCLGIHEIRDEEAVEPLKPVVRIATEDDRQRLVENKIREKEALEIAEERTLQHQLDMKLVDAEYTFDQKKIIFYFTADGRVDFRELVRDLASRFRVRIELRQIGVRDEAKMLGGLGPCGRPCCCKTFMSDFVPVSIRMAKDQNISLNPVKISGLCGRLMCCLQFEHDHYSRTKSELPKVGSYVLTPDGPGEVVEHQILKEAARVRIMDSENNPELRSYRVADMESINKSRYEELTSELEQQAREREERRAAEFAEARARVRSESRQQHGSRPKKGRPEKEASGEEKRAEEEQRPAQASGKGNGGRQAPRNRDQNRSRAERRENGEGNAAEEEKASGNRGPQEGSGTESGAKPARQGRNRRWRRPRRNQGAKSPEGKQ